MPFEVTRPASDPISALVKYIHQRENAGSNLLRLVKGSQDGTDVNFLEFEFSPTALPEAIIEPITVSVETQSEIDAACAQLEASGKAVQFLAPVFDQGAEKMVALCRLGQLPSIIPVAGNMVEVPSPSSSAGSTEQNSTPFHERASDGRFRGNSSRTTGLEGTIKAFANGVRITDGTETLSAVRGGRNFGAKQVRQIRTFHNQTELVQQPDYCWLQRSLPDALLVRDFSLPSNAGFTAGKATKFGKLDQIDEGTGSELLKVVQTNSEVFGCSLKLSILTAAFGAPLRNKPDLLKALVEIFNPTTRRFARVPIVDVGPSERLEAKIDLTFALDRFLGTEGSGRVEFRIVKPA